MGDSLDFLGIDLYLVVVEDTTDGMPIPLTVSTFPDSLIPRFPDSTIPYLSYSHPIAAQKRLKIFVLKVSS